MDSSSELSVVRNSEPNFYIGTIKDTDTAPLNYQGSEILSPFSVWAL